MRFTPAETRRPNCTLEQLLEYYENEIEKDQEKSFPETELVKLGFTKQEHVDMVAILKALNGRGLLHIMPSDSFPEKVEQFTAVSIAKT